MIKKKPTKEEIQIYNRFCHTVLREEMDKVLRQHNEAILKATEKRIKDEFKKKFSGLA